MAERVKLCRRDEAPRVNAVCEVHALGRKLCLANVQGKFYAMENECPHRMGPLGEGTIEDGMVLCPWHARGFNPATGECRESAEARVKTYAVDVDGEELMLKLE